jgi:cell division protease FtsH
VIENKQKILDVAEALLARETLDAEQVKRICAGIPLDEPTSGTPAATPPREAAKAPAAKERPATAIVPAIPPRPVTQE